MSPPATDTETTITAVAARLRAWTALNMPGIVWIRYVSDLSRDVLLEQLSAERPIERIAFNPPDPAEAADWLEERLTGILGGNSMPVAAVLFSIRSGEAAFAAWFRALNLRREVIARFPVIQLWFVPASVAPDAEAQALDLASWFQIRIRLTEIVPEGRSDLSETRPPSRNGESIQNLEVAVARQRRLAAQDAPSYLSRLATTLNDLASAYREKHRLAEAENALAEALEIGRDLTRTNRQDYLSGVASTLNNLGVLYSETQRPEGAERAYKEALQIYRGVARANPPDIATTLNNLANLYTATRRLAEAENAYREALQTYRDAAKTNPQAYLPDVALALNNVAVLYLVTQRIAEAERAFGEARAIVEPTWERNPQLHGDLMANIYGTGALIAELRKSPDACEFSRKMLGCAYEPRLKETARELIAKFCRGTTVENSD